ncbi:MAG: oxidoreductase-like domain-containing protein [Pseudomonadota bacterium]
MNEDPRPQPPEQPLPEDCCRSGCMPCVFDLYEEALTRYELALQAWLLRHRDANSSQ